MEILKKIIIANNSQAILLQCDSRNDNSLSKFHQNCKTNYSNNNNIKTNYINLNNDDIQTKKTIKIPLSSNKLKISLENKNIKKENEINTDYEELSCTDIENKKNESNDNNSNNSNIQCNYAFNKNFMINNNITNNISNHITNIILTNNNNFNIKKKFLNKRININLDDKKLIHGNNTNNNINFISQRKDNNSKNIINRNNNYLKKENYSLTNGNNDIKMKKNILLSNRDKILSEKLISTKNKNFVKRNNNKKINKFFTTSSTNNIIHNNKIKNNKQEIKNKNIKECDILKYKNKSINNIEINCYKNKLINSNKKLKDNNSVNNINQKCINKFRPSLKFLENTTSLKSTYIKESNNKIKNLKKIQTGKNYIINYNCNSSRDTDKNTFGKILKEKHNSFNQKNKNNKQYKSNLNINIDNILSFSKLKSLINNKRNSKSFIDTKNNNNSFNIPIIISKGDLKNSIIKNNKTQESTYQLKYNNKSKEIINLKNPKNLKIIKLINNNKYKTERDNDNQKIETSNNNINTLNSISKKTNIFINKNKSFIINYNRNLLKNKSFQNRKNRISMNMNIHKNIKKQLFTKSIVKKNDKINYINNYKNNSYNSYKEQYILNMVKSYKNFSYTSQDKNKKKDNNNKEKKNKYYNNHKKIHENQISKIKKNNRCKKDNVELSTININHNDLVSLVNIKYNKKSNIIKDKMLNKEILKPIFNNKRKYPNYIITNKKDKKKEELNAVEDNNKDYEMKNSKRKKIDSIPKHLLKNILNINSFNENCFQENKIKSARISPYGSSNNFLIKNYRNSIYKKDYQLEKNKSFKISMNQIFNIPYNNIMSLNKKKKLKISDIINKKNNKNRKTKESINSTYEKEKEKEIKKKNESENYLETFEISEEEKSKDKEINKILINENIKNNPQYLCDYLFDILENFLLDESFYIKKKYINPDYLFSINNTELTPEIRVVSINWLIMINHKIFKFKENTLFLCAQIIDRFLSKKLLNIEKTELLILCSLILASKHEEIDYVNMIESLQLSSNKFTKEQIINMEYEILNELNFEIIIPNMIDYYNIYTIILNLSDIEKNKGLYLLNIILIDYYMLEYPNFLLSLAVIKIIINKKVTFLIEIIKDLLKRNNEDIFLNMLKEEKTIDDICDKIKILFKKFLGTNNKNIQDKFSGEKYNYVSNNPNEIFDCFIKENNL